MHHPSENAKGSGGSGSSLLSQLLALPTLGATNNKTTTSACRSVKTMGRFSVESSDWTESLSFEQEDTAGNDSHTDYEEDDDTSSLPSSTRSASQSPTSVSMSTSVFPDETAAAAASLEGVLYWRRGRKSSSKGTSSLFWKRRYVVLDLQEGSISAYSAHQQQKKTRTVTPTKLHRSRSMHQHSTTHKWHIPASSDWMVKDIEKDSSCFVLEIMSPMETPEEDDTSTSMITSSTDQDLDLDLIYANNSRSSMTLDQSTSDNIHNNQQQQPSIRFYFKCRQGANEKVLWLKAFAKLKRLSANLRANNKRFSVKRYSWRAPRVSQSRTRTSSAVALAQESMHLDLQSSVSSSAQFQQEANSILSDSTTCTHTPDKNKHNKRQKEYRVLPERCYPNLWMTQQELQEEMEKPSQTFHDLQQQQQHQSTVTSQPPVIGSIQLEVLQGIGFPKLDRYSKTDAVVYVVCGPYAFATDVIQDKQSPMWLAKSQRACSIPLHHAYARVYVGVFGDEKKKKSTKDDFNGRCVIDVARLRPNSTYDVTLPLRLSAHVYSRRQRGAIRLRFRLQWTSVRSALLSYLPDKIPTRPPKLQDFQPNTDTVVPCGSARAFRNVAITIHGAHLPGRFSFQQLRATLREINFTRKSVLRIARTTITDLREWRNPLLSFLVFGAWMHCVYSNMFSLVPGYWVLYWLVLLLRNYARYGMDGPAQRGFIPPSWEELLRGLLLPHHDAAIRPLDMGFHVQQDEEEDGEGTRSVHYKVDTHQPRGKPLFRAMGFLEEDANDAFNGDNSYDLEFPYADGNVYPRFNVEHSLATGKRSRRHRSGKGNHSPKSHSQRLRLGLSKIMRKDSSGLNDYDDEEQRFATGKFIRQTGATQLMGAATGLMGVGETLGEATGLQYVVSPVVNGGQLMVSPVIKGGQLMVSPVIKGVKTGHNAIETSIRGLNNHVVSPLVVSPLHHTVDLVRRTSNEYLFQHNNNSGRDGDSEVEGDDMDSLLHLDHQVESSALHYRNRLDTGGLTMDSIAELEVESEDFHHDDDISEVNIGNDDAATDRTDSGSSACGSRSADRMPPDQDIDYDGSNSATNKDKNGKRLTDDLQDIKDQMHQFTLQKFNDRAYIVQDPDSQFFGRTETPTNANNKRRKNEVKKDLNKLLQIGQYSHSNPVVGRVGQYVEPVVGASHSFLNAFRALFNVMTWRDPFLSFWVSLFGIVLVAILFVFPWRIFFFLLGLWFVGPQNLVQRILRQKGILPPKKTCARPSTSSNVPRETDGTPPVSSDQVVFQGHISQDQKHKLHKPVDPKQVQHVVVPYSPLMYQRFYDWPPEQEYSQVYSQNHVTSDMQDRVTTTANGYFSSAIAEGKKTQ